VIPSTLLGVAVLVAGVTPGYIYLRLAEERVQRRERSALGETAELVFVGVITTSVSVALAVAVAKQLKVVTSVDLRSGLGLYLADHTSKAFLLIVGMLLLSYAFAALAALIILRGRPRSIAAGDVTRQVLGRDPGKTAFATIELDTGWAFSGPVLAYSLESEAPNREIVLYEPIHARRPGGKASRLDDSFLVVATKDATYVSVKYRDTARHDTPSTRRRVLPAFGRSD
jgi:hypothetical protein